MTAETLREAYKSYCWYQSEVAGIERASKAIATQQHIMGEMVEDYAKERSLDPGDVAFALVTDTLDSLTEV